MIFLWHCYNGKIITFCDLGTCNSNPALAVFKLVGKVPIVKER